MEPNVTTTRPRPLGKRLEKMMSGRSFGTPPDFVSKAASFVEGAVIGHAEDLGWFVLQKRENGTALVWRERTDLPLPECPTYPRMNCNGYLIECAPGHPAADKNGIVLQHRRIMSDFLYAKYGRHIRRDETVHHKNGIRTDNRLENLGLWVGHHSTGTDVDSVVKHAIELLSSYGYTVIPPNTH